MKKPHRLSRLVVNIFPATIILFLAVSATAQIQSGPDYVLVNGKIFTVEATHPYAQALAIKGERILAVGTSEEISRLASSRTIRIDLQGRLVIPGINDAHYQAIRRALCGHHWLSCVLLVALDRVRRVAAASRHLPGAVWSSFSGGFLDFYDVKTPFDPRVHAEMRAVLLTAVFGFALAVALAVAARRPLSPALLRARRRRLARDPARPVAAGSWSALLILLGGLAVLAGLTTRARSAGRDARGRLRSCSPRSSRRPRRRWRKAGSSRGSGWDFYTAPQTPVSVEFVWDAQYAASTSRASGRPCSR